MVTAILPSIAASASKKRLVEANNQNGSESPRALDPNTGPGTSLNENQDTSGSPSRLAGIVGLSTGIGALLALLIFIPLPAFIQRRGQNPTNALAYSYYLVGAFAFVMSAVCFLGLRNLPDEQGKGYIALYKVKSPAERNPQPYYLLYDALKLGFQDRALGLAYIGGFVARASSVAITLFIPLHVNHCFISSELCNADGKNQKEIPKKCSDAFVLASQLTGISQTAALVFALIFGFCAGRLRSPNIPLGVAALSGCLGYFLFVNNTCSAMMSRGLGPYLIGIMLLLGFSQIGAIVCSLGLLGRCVLEIEHLDQGRVMDASEVSEDTAPLIPKANLRSRRQIKGSVAGIYSLGGGLGILILTKVGGLLFDRVSIAAPFIIIASFNAISFGASLLDALLSWRITANR
ncbi:uncharacterized protein KY384_008322 [Bacidia gigantensis]|uniref:uncharacterized protein n=1 Tax=Bacidia gigantensis TaxID=2732470 RepID=UPI001D04021F|nr:uncharacterized protein KY384_008322 [Bacidia gigantensis]KAG8526893.1 hypothetical protein KY384_008322 [Bacidia gigantensis]